MVHGYRYKTSFIIFLSLEVLKPLEPISSWYLKSLCCFNKGPYDYSLVSSNTFCLIGVYNNFDNEPRHVKTNKMSVCPAKTQISLGIRPVWSESSLCTQWVAKDPSFLHADSEDWSDWACVITAEPVKPVFLKTDFVIRILFYTYWCSYEFIGNSLRGRSLFISWGAGQFFGKPVISSATPLPNFYFAVDPPNNNRRFVMLTPPPHGPTPLLSQQIITLEIPNGFQNVIKHEINKKDETVIIKKGKK